MLKAKTYSVKLHREYTGQNRAWYRHTTVFSTSRRAIALKCSIVNTLISTLPTEMIAMHNEDPLLRKTGVTIHQLFGQSRPMLSTEISGSSSIKTDDSPLYLLLCVVQ